MSDYGRFGPLVAAIDEGTSSCRFIIFCPRTSEIIVSHQIPLKMIYPQSGWVEQDPIEIINAINQCIKEALDKLMSIEVKPSDICSVGITNQRESVVAWDKVTGKPFYNAIVWSDTRAQDFLSKLLDKVPNKDINHWKSKNGLPLCPTFSASKFKWILEEIPEVKEAANKNRLCLGTIDSWVIFNLTRGKNGGGGGNGVHVTDCTNASRTFLMNLDTLEWDPELCELFQIQPEWLPQIKSSSEIYGTVTDGPLEGMKISGCLGDQQAALLGHLCLEPGQAKNTYGTGCFLLCNVGPVKMNSKNGLLTTVAYKLGADVPAVFALEGSVAVAGAALNWLRDNLGILDDSQSVEAIVEAVKGTDNVYFVPAFSGMYAPYWEQNARGVVVGITEDTKDSHLIKAALEAVCFQTRDLVEAMEKDCGFPLKSLLVDGGMTKNNFLMQLQADLMGVPVVRPGNSEMTALGAAIAAGSAKGIEIWKFDRITSPPSKIFVPSISKEERESRYSKWKEAVERSFRWNLG